MTETVARDGEAEDALLDALLYSVSHDLRSPLLAMTLSAEIVETAVGEDGALPEPAPIALASLRESAVDMERMLRALMLLSRARRREVEPARCTLRMLLGGYEVDAATEVLDTEVSVDLLALREALDAATDETGAPIGVRIDPPCVELRIAVPEIDDEPSPVHALTGSLKHHAGTRVETLAVAQILLERQGGAAEASGGTVVLRVPLAQAGTTAAG